MTPRQRSRATVALSTLMVAAGVGMVVFAVAGPDHGGQGPGQYVDGGRDAERAAPTSTSTAAPTDDDLAGVGGDDQARPAPRLDDLSARPRPEGSDDPDGDTLAGGADDEGDDGDGEPSDDVDPEGEGSGQPEPTPAPTPAPTDPPPTPAPTPEPTPAPTPAPAPAGLNPVEAEILRLTNELRADPAGPLAREKGLPSCVSNDFYGIDVDPATGQPRPVPALTVNEQVSVSLSRAWAQEMEDTGSFRHRSDGSAVAVYGSLGLSPMASGENIAWFPGYPDSMAARIHFEGWRESDSGHYCALVSPTFTGIGVGHVKGERRSWAVQNFFRLR